MEEPMLDSNIIEQLKSVYSALENEIVLQIYKSEHEKNIELKEMLESIATTSDKIKLEEIEESSKAPKFRILYQGKPNGVSFVGVPGGHEFTSLILAILNSDHKGKLPDDGIIKRIKNIKGPISLRTFISLSCENCPEVVQAMNLVAIYNENIQHEMVDGEFFQDEIEELKIQGVPSVMHGNELFSSGKNNLAGLIEKLETKFGAEEAEAEDLGQFDVVVVGGGPAGASAAIYTARKGLKTAVIAERIGGQVQDTKGIENLISIPYIEGPELSSHLAKHMSEYDIKVLENRRVEEVEDHEIGHSLKLNSPEFLSTKTIIVATGAKWRELNVPGEKEYIGRGVAFCPHCDGPYYKGKDIAVIGGGNSGVEAAIDLAGIVKSVTVIEFASELKADQVLIKKLESLTNTRVIKNAKTNEVIGDGDKVTAIEVEDRTTGEVVKHQLDGVFVQIGLIPNSGFIKNKVETNKFGEIIVNEKCKTSTKGIYAAGDVTTVPYKQIIISMGEGAKAGLTVFEDLMINS
tara:strand:- start:51874 stop:53430 length:1557 start_codon:yes stop_codon:yes gene_type:complete